MIMNISALRMDEAETMLKAVDKVLHRVYGIYAHRRTSFNRRANDNIRAQIRVDVPEKCWHRVGCIIVYEAYLMLGHKWVVEHTDTIGALTYIEFSTEEAEI